MEILELHSTRVPSVKSDGTRKAISDPLNSIFFSCQAKNFSMLRAISNCCDKDTPQKQWWSFYSETGLYLLKKHFSLTENMKICNCNRWSYCKKSHTMNCYIHKNCVQLQMIVQEAESAHPGHKWAKNRGALMFHFKFNVHCIDSHFTFTPSLCQWDYWHSEELSKPCLALSRAQDKNFSPWLNNDQV